MPFTNRYETRAEWADCDPLGQMFYPNYFRWFDIGTHRLLEAAGEPYDRLVARHGIAGLPLVDAQASFRGRGRWTDHMEVESFVSEWGRKSFTVSHIVRNGGEIAVEGREVRIWALFHPDDPTRLTTAQIPQDFRDMLA